MFLGNNLNVKECKQKVLLEANRTLETEGTMFFLICNRSTISEQYQSFVILLRLRSGNFTLQRGTSCRKIVNEVELWFAMKRMSHVDRPFQCSGVIP